MNPGTGTGIRILKSRHATIMIRKKNINSDGWREASHGDKLHRVTLSMGNLKDDALLGCTAYSVKPGKRAFPKHGHLVNDEAIYVISGSGMVDGQTIEQDDFLLTEDESAVTIEPNGEMDLFVIELAKKLPYRTYAERAARLN